MDVQQSNPFQTPQADLQQTTAQHPPLYSVAGVGLATFIGTPLAGAWLLAHNLQLLGQAHRVAMVWGISVVLLLVTLVLAFVLPEEVPALPFAVAQLMVMIMLAKNLMEADLKQHVEAGGAFLSNWRAAGIGLLFTIGLAALMFAVLMIFDI
ncbi:hypothetical protein [Ectopseudomonas mendocina]|uniref:Uncharacterized protein n=1 Tax=Ectopseudomonas mendocina S5.2 TaxID=1225174 RepID=A0ABM5VTT1_ECTME|nr:hypothetical protein [Pseudomonas mendocina]ALN18204.1 hypothetical protein DW68_006070 [Pseudomonas mendocina S5.2]KES00961.1 hypothetical protein HN51_14210 [Pseudomonas mendocina]MDF2076679.1 hypothetical protein [Pseudomonas mendocina]VEE16944.1 Uncharacterised protein [Pseudomonas mendocina]